MTAHPTHVLVRAATSTAKRGSPVETIVLVVFGLLVVGYLFTNSRRRQRAAQAQQSEIEIGTMIVTRAGLIATLVDRTDDYVVLQLDDGTRARYVPAAVAQAWHEPVPDDPAGAEVPVDDDPPSGE